MEQGNEIVQKLLNFVDIKNFKRVFDKDGLDLTQNFQFVNFNRVTHDIISLFFNKQEIINPEVVTGFLRFTNKEMNKFNHNSDKYIWTMKEIERHHQAYHRGKKIIA